MYRKYLVYDVGVEEIPPLYFWEYVVWGKLGERILKSVLSEEIKIKEGLSAGKRTGLRRGLGILAGICLLICVATGISVGMSYHCLAVTNWSISAEKLSQPVTVVVLSDLHEHEFGRGNEKLVSLVAEQSPDLILMTGDFVNDISVDSDVAVDLTKKLSEIAPVYYAWGNHELAYMERTGEDLAVLLEEAGACVLDLEWQEVVVQDQCIRIGGMYDYAFALDNTNSTSPETMEPAVYEFLTAFQDTEAFTLMMAHRPESFVLGEASKTWDIDLVVSGHDHGGQVILPVLGGLWAGDQGWFPDYVEGYHEKDKLKIFITRGLGSQQQKLPRCNNLPEVAVLKLEPAGQE